GVPRRDGGGPRVREERVRGRAERRLYGGGGEGDGGVRAIQRRPGGGGRAGYDGGVGAPRPDAIAPSARTGTAMGTAPGPGPPRRSAPRSLVHTCRGGVVRRAPDGPGVCQGAADPGTRSAGGPARSRRRADRGASADLGNCREDR